METNRLGSNYREETMTDEQVDEVVKKAARKPRKPRGKPKPKTGYRGLLDPNLYATKDGRVPKLVEQVADSRVVIHW